MKPVAHLTPAELQACARVAERRGLTPWIVENFLYRFKLGDKLPMHMLDVVQEVNMTCEVKSAGVCQCSDIRTSHGVPLGLSGGGRPGS